jgi:hypothetical protein
MIIGVMKPYMDVKFFNSLNFAHIHPNRGNYIHNIRIFEYNIRSSKLRFWVENSFRRSSNT